jgi:hypothetical protein
MNPRIWKLTPRPWIGTGTPQSSSAVNQAAQDLKARHNGEFEGSELFKKLDQLPTIWNFTLPVIIILVVVACVVVFCK